MNAYSDMKARHEKEYADQSPAKYAYSQDQARRMFEEWGLNFDDENDQKKVAQVATGVFVLVEDIDKFFSLIRRMNTEISEAVAADTTGENFILDMFRDELRNHEYIVTLSYEETLEALGYTESDLENNPALLHGLKVAAAEIRTEYENGEY